ncbi:acyltransferase family protein [Terrabacter sp. BE26]|uniref:acyltransferase family protein n=1 Tax=Terrabacter sp. BE26 TaxID=2898152 RepID=UPI0035BE31A7
MPPPSDSANEPPSRPGRIDSWDVLRGLAVGLVMLRHAWPAEFPGAGVAGVTMFFGLSGFLITDIIQGEVARSGQLSFVRFYRNRFYRLIPAVAVLLLVYLVVELFTGRLHDRAPFVSVAVGLLYLADVPGIHTGPGLGHLWTLAVEEQFYLVWPTLLIFGIRRSRVGAVVATAIVGTLLVTALALTVSSTTATVYTLPTSWAPALLVGAAGRMYIEKLRTVVRPWALVLAGMGLVSACWLPDAKDKPLTYLVVGPLIAFSAAVLVIGSAPYSSVPTWLKPLRMLGRISYAVYLWNFPIVCWLRGGFQEGTSGYSLLSIGLSIVAGTASWYLVEEPMQRVKRRLHGGGTRQRSGTEMARTS